VGVLENIKYMEKNSIKFNLEKTTKILKGFH